MRGQAAKYLLKGFDASTLPGVMENMGKHENVVEHEEVCYSEGEDLLAGDALGDIFDFRAATLTRTVYEAVKVLQLASRDSRRRICMRCSFASRREHIEAFLLGEFVNKLKRLPASRFQLPHRPPSRQSSANSSPCSV
jgi:acyl-CoA oxidase